MNLIVAVDDRWGIGADNGLLASIPGDMAFFKRMTGGKVVVMGRKTLESLPGGRGLPGRTNIVMTRQPGFTAERCIVVRSDEELFAELARFDTDDVFIIGGASIYSRFYAMCDKLYVTRMYADLGADTFMVNLDEDDGFEITEESCMYSENGIDYKFYTYERVKRAEEMI